MKATLKFTCATLAIGISALLGVQHSAAQTDTRVLESSLLSGSERLALFSMSELLERSPSLALLNIAEPRMRRLGFTLLSGEDYPRGVIAHQVSVAPILTYDDNINGGNRNDSFELGGITFEGDPDTAALAGILVGAAVGSETRLSYGRGRYLSFAAGASAAYSPEHNIGRYSLNGRICSENHIREWMFFDLCGSASRSITDLDATNTYAIDASFANMFSFAGGDHEVSFGVRRTIFEDYNQNSISLDWTGSFGDVGVFDANLVFGEDVEGELALDNSISVGYTNSIFDRRTRFFVSRSVFDGGTFFGMPREEERYSVGVSTEINDRFSVGVRATRNESTVEFYEYESVNFFFNIRGFRF